MGKAKGDTEADHLSGRTQENRAGAESTVGKDEGREEFVIRRPGVKCGVVLTRR